ncbi:gag protease polyprotein [Cucumis melo var. makuwa]|uniref:Gag protease polyprotein n=1 Tax=Cucumis melo var. makuwa TaxID=1194695 RepID=A0A5D3BCJ2_CUCMM|nr:gag protease polyprotein [Cucumis melo var. makuwa]
MLGGDGDRKVEQYDAEFDMLSRLALEMIVLETAIADKFIRGLRLDTRVWFELFDLPVMPMHCAWQ